MSPIHIYDPGGHVKVMEETLFAFIPKARRKSVVVREGRVSSGGEIYSLPKVTLDSGASHASYVGKKIVDSMSGLHRYPCKHKAKLGDGTTFLEVNEFCVLHIQLMDDYGCPTELMHTECYIVEGLGEEVIVGLPDILGSYFDFFVAALSCGRSGTKLSVMSDYDRVCMLMSEVKREVEKAQP